MYQEFRTALVYETDEDALTVNPYPNFNQSSLERNMDFWRRNRDLLIIFSGAVSYTHLTLPTTPYV